MARRIAMTIAAVLASAAAFGISSTDYPDADCVIVNDETKIEYRADGSFVYENDEKILALTEKGRRSLRTVSVDISRRYGDAEIAKVEIIGKDGSVRDVDFRATLKDATDNSSVSENIYDPLDRRISCSVPEIEIGDTRRVIVRKRIVKPRMRDTFAAHRIFESLHPIIRSSFEVTAPSNRPLAAIKLRNAVNDTVRRIPDRRLADGRIVYSWIAENVPQAFPEPDMPPFSSVAQKILVSTCPSWEDVSKWYWQLCLPRLEATDAGMTNKVHELICGLDSREAKIRALFKFVSQEVRYMGLTMEDESPGYAPHDVRITFNNRYGVCRDKAALLVQMLRIAGFEAYPVLINAGTKIDENIPLPFFNHAIVWCGELMDPTNESTHDLLPAYLDNCSYLVAHPAGRPLRTIPAKPASGNAFTATTEGSLLPDGSAIIRTKAQFGGVNDLFRGSFMKMTVSDRRRMFENLLRRSFPGAELLAFEMLPRNLHDTDSKLNVELSARLPDVIIRGNTRNELKPPFVFDGFAIADRLLTGSCSLDERRYPLVLFSTAKSEEKLILKIDSAAIGKPVVLPPEISANSAGCRYTREINAADGKLCALRRWEIDTVEISPEDYGELKYALQEIERKNRAMPQFSAQNDNDAHVRTLIDRREISLTSPFEWTITNTWQKEILSYAGKKENSELTYSFNPCIGKCEIITASVSNKNGILHLSPAEINILDARWAAAAPRYPASKTLVANLPGVETGSVITVTTAMTVTNSPIGYCNLFLFDSVDPIGIKELKISGYPLKILHPRTSDDVRDENLFLYAVTNPPCLKRESGTPPALLWRDCVLVSAADADESRNLFAALEKARNEESETAKAKARELTGGISSPKEKIAVIRNWLYKNVRIAGPGLYALPFNKAFFSPDRSIKDAYASKADWMNLYFTMLEAAGFEAEFVLTDGDANGYEKIRNARRTVPQPDDFTSLFIRASVCDGATLGIFGGDRHEFILACENEFTPVGIRDIDGRDARTVDFMSIDLNATGAARITVSNSTWGTEVGILRKRYAEMLPEIRSRNYAELLGGIAESAEAVSSLETDIDGYPFTLSFTAYVPGYAYTTEDSMTLELPDIGGKFLPSSGPERKNPFGDSGRIRSITTIREVIFPEEYSEIEHLPNTWEMLLPGENSARSRLSVTKSVENGRLKITFREELLPSVATMFSNEWTELFRYWNRRTDSPLIRTLSVRKSQRE